MNSKKNIGLYLLATLLPIFGLFAQDPCGILDQLEFDKVCDNQATYCMGIPINEFFSHYELRIDGVEYTAAFSACDLDTIITYNYRQLVDPGPDGPYIIQSWTINDSIYTSGEIENIFHLVDTINKWDTTNDWELNQITNRISASVDNVSNYSHMTILHIPLGITSILPSNESLSINGTSFSSPQGTYEIQLENTLTNCIDTITIEVPNYPSFQIESLQVLEESCDGNDAIITIQTSGGLGNLSYTWDNGIGTIQDSILTNISAGNYHVTVTDDGHCEELVDSIFVNGPLDYNVSSNVFSCNLNNSSAEVILNTPINNPSFSWSNGATTQMVNNLAFGWYSVTVTNDNGCVSHKNIEVKAPDNCIVLISGYVHLDSISSNCIDDGEFEINEIKVELLQDNINKKITTPDSDGFYQFQANEGDYNLKLIYDAQNTTLACPASNDIAVSATVLGNVYDNNNFYLHSDQTNLSVSAFALDPRSNTIQNIKIYYENLTPHDANEVVINLAFDPLLEYIDGSVGAVFNEIDSEVTLSLPTATAFSEGIFNVRLNIPSTIPLGTPLTYSASISTVDEEVSLSDNSYSWTQEVRNSYDPNDKIGFPHGIGDQNSITPSDSILTYRINFQNTGNDTAYAVVLRDSLDLDVFDIRSIKTLESSHDFESESVEENVLIYDFQNIYLPDSTNNLEESQGYVIFQIHLNRALPLGTRINNSAAIFFDYNPPIITNTTLHTISDFTNTENVSIFFNNLNIFPNPTKNLLQINFELSENTNVNIRLLDIYGRQVQTILKDQPCNIGFNNLMINNLNIPDGLYFLNFEIEGQSFLEKILVIE